MVKQRDVARSRMALNLFSRTSGRFWRIQSPVTLVIVASCAVLAPVVLAQYQESTSTRSRVISGRVVDPHQLRPEQAVLVLGREDDGGFASTPVPVAADGSFVTPPLEAGVYILEIVRTPHSPTKPATTVGFRVVHVGASDVSGVSVAVERDVALTGTFRMETDNPRAEWPPHIVVNAHVAVEGRGFLGSQVAEGAAGGRFVLRNVFGPRVLRCGYTLTPGHDWWPSRVMLDGVDITNVPTDFSNHENGKLEVVFTQHPARIVGTVLDAKERPARAPWILFVSAEPKLWQSWATTSTVTQGNTQGAFSLAVTPGAYLVRAVPQETFHSWPDARSRIEEFATSGVRVDVTKEREATSVTLHLSGSSQF